MPQPEAFELIDKTVFDFITDNHLDSFFPDNKSINLHINKLIKIPNRDGNKVNLLILACEKGDIKAVKALLKVGAKIDEGDFYDKTALMFAIQNGHKEIVRLLIEKGADVNQNTTHKNTPLMLAINNNDEEMVIMLINNDAKINSLNHDNRSPLIFSILTSNQRIMKLLLQKGADVHLGRSNNSGLKTQTLFYEKNALETLVQKYKNQSFDHKTIDNLLDPIISLLEKGAFIRTEIFNEGNNAASNLALKIITENGATKDSNGNLYFPTNSLRREFENKIKAQEEFIEKHENIFEFTYAEDKKTVIEITQIKHSRRAQRALDSYDKTTYQFQGKLEDAVAKHSFKDVDRKNPVSQVKEKLKNLSSNLKTSCKIIRIDEEDYLSITIEGLDNNSLTRSKTSNISRKNFSNNLSQELDIRCTSRKRSDSNQKYSKDSVLIDYDGKFEDKKVTIVLPKSFLETQNSRDQFLIGLEKVIDQTKIPSSSPNKTDINQVSPSPEVIHRS